MESSPSGCPHPAHPPIHKWCKQGAHEGPVLWDMVLGESLGPVEEERRRRGVGIYLHALEADRGHAALGESLGVGRRFPLVGQVLKRPPPCTPTFAPRAPGVGCKADELEMWSNLPGCTVVIEGHILETCPGMALFGALASGSKLQPPCTGLTPCGTDYWR